MKTDESAPNTISIATEEALRVFSFLESVHELMHQPLSYGDPQIVEQFVKSNYSEAKELYYRVVWNWLPKELQDRIASD